MYENIQIKKISEKSIRDIYYVLFRHKWKIVLFFFAVVITVTVVTFLTPEIYRSDAKLLVRLGRENVTLDPTATGQVVSLNQTRESEIKSELEILMSRDLAEKIVDSIGAMTFLNPPEEVFGEFIRFLERLGLSSKLNDRDKAIEKVMRNLDIQMQRNSNIISISYEAKTRKLAQEVIERLIGYYLDKHINVHRTAGSYEFFTQQTDRFRNSLARVEENLRELKDKTNIASLEEQRQVLIRRINDLQREVEGTESALVASKAKVQALQRTLDNLPETLVIQETTGNTNQGTDLMRSKLYDLQLKEQDLLSKFNSNSKLVQEIRRQIAEAQTLLEKEEPTRTQVTRGLNEAYKQVQSALLSETANFSSLQAKVVEQGAQLQKARNELKAINHSEMYLVQVQREMSIQESNYRKYYEKLEQTRIDNALEMVKISNISLVQPATYPLKQVRPRKNLNLTLALFFGFFGGIGLAFFSEYLDHTFKKPEDIGERLKLQPLAVIPRIGKRYV